MEDLQLTADDAGFGCFDLGFCLFGYRRAKGSQGDIVTFDATTDVFALPGAIFNRLDNAGEEGAPGVSNTGEPTIGGKFLQSIRVEADHLDAAFLSGLDDGNR